MQVIDSIEQGSEAWKNIRLGIVTASDIDVLMVDGKGEGGFGVGAFTYMDRLIGERITGSEAEPWRGNASSERGHILEPEVRKLYAIRRGFDPSVIEHAAIILNHGVGYSPDGMVGGDGLIEVKTKLPEKLISVKVDGVIPKEHIAQCQAGLWVSEREWIDFIGYWPGMPMVLVRAQRDEAYIRKMAQRTKDFLELLEARMELVLAA